MELEARSQFILFWNLTSNIINVTCATQSNNLLNFKTIPENTEKLMTAFQLMTKEQPRLYPCNMFLVKNIKTIISE